MDARDVFRDQLRLTLGPALRAEGFAGSGSNWRKRNQHGDWACINIQKSAWGSAGSVSAYVNLSIYPLPVHLFSEWFDGRSPAKQPTASRGLWFARLNPKPQPGRPLPTAWEFGDGSSGATVMGEMVDLLRVDGIPRLHTLLDRTVLLGLLADTASEQVEGGYLMTWSRPAMRALLLSGGRTPALDAALAEVEREAALQADEDQSRRLHAVLTWVRQRTASTALGPP